MENTPWSKEMREQRDRFGRLLLTLRAELEAARDRKVQVAELPISEIDCLLEQFERGLLETEELDRQWEAKQPELLALHNEGLRLREQTGAMKIQCQADYEQAQKRLTEIQKHQDLVHAVFEPFVIASERNYKHLEMLEKQLRAKLNLRTNGD